MTHTCLLSCHMKSTHNMPADATNNPNKTRPVSPQSYKNSKQVGEGRGRRVSARQPGEGGG